jgi:ribosomal protein S18 acetylase RimI-like enzyme
VLEPVVVPLEGRREVAAGALLARAFADDPLARYLFPRGPQRASRLRWHYTALVRYGRLAGAVDAVESPPAPGGRRGLPEGVAVWHREDDPAVDRAVRLHWLQRSGLLDAPAVLGAETFGKVVAMVGQLDGHRRLAVPGAHWYLNQVGVHPARRGRGTGSALLRPGLARAAAAGLPCYLETFGAGNLAFYRRLGFEVLVADVEPTSGLPFWTCRLQPPSQPVLNRG